MQFSIVAVPICSQERSMFKCCWVDLVERRKRECGPGWDAEHRRAVTLRRGALGL